jgi:hypothetical protein
LAASATDPTAGTDVGYTLFGPGLPCSRYSWEAGTAPCMDIPVDNRWILLNEALPCIEYTAAKKHRATA